MAKAASGSQAATLVPRSASTGGTAAARAPPTAAGLRKRTSENLPSTLRCSSGVWFHELCSCVHELCDLSCKMTAST